MLDNVHGNQRFVKHFQAQFTGVCSYDRYGSPWQVFPTTQESLSGTSTIDGDNHLYRFSIFAISILT